MAAGHLPCLGGPPRAGSVFESRGVGGHIHVYGICDRCGEQRQVWVDAPGTGTRMVNHEFPVAGKTTEEIYRYHVGDQPI